MYVLLVRGRDQVVLEGLHSVLELQGPHGIEPGPVGVQVLEQLTGLGQVGGVQTVPVYCRHTNIILAISD